jgi:beta-ribofuranosylaminobenzene 5'-phosphate synthase
MIRVRAPSRLHFGLLSFSAAERWPNTLGQEVVAARQFGGVGLMIDTPGLRLTARPAADWSAEGLLAERALAYARRFVQTLPARAVPPQHLIIEQSAPEHMGLGAGTQLGLAVARALAEVAGAPLDEVELARRVGRGARSAVGIHGFARGGFLVEGGKHTAEAVAPLLMHLAFPESWRLVLVLPPWGRGRHGAEESEAFQSLASRRTVLSQTDALCRLVLLGLVPALLEQDLEAFGEALYDFNVRVGELFAPVQGGTYAHARVADLVEFVRRQGVRGVGQSSWGPAVFVVVEDEERAADLAWRAREAFALRGPEVFAARGCSRGATLETVQST